MDVRLHDEAVAEARSAREWYEARNPTAAFAFFVELDRAVDLIAESPGRYPAYVLGTRRYLMRRFPFSVIYRVESDHVLIVALAHAKRRPGYWRKRR
ncbi:MAG: type II toxin-antitoxin system RelE/ParE family toxin [Candidatus Riflebacteria bacterium]|nr:type II toxin-antitoxin system RelE/ParE family toxin [Candidatus Riflebacteria bacterium]